MKIIVDYTTMGFFEENRRNSGICLITQFYQTNFDNTNKNMKKF